MRFKRQPNSINTRLLITGLVPMLLLSAVLGWYMISSQRADLLANLHSTGKIIANQIASNSEFALYSGNQEALQVIGDSVLKVPSVSGLMFYNNRDNSSLVVGSLAHDLVGIPASFYLDAPLLTNNLWHFYAPIDFQLDSFEDYDEALEAEVQTLGWVVLALDTELLFQKQKDIIAATVVVILFALLIAIWLAMNLGRSISRTLGGLTQVVELMEAGDLDSLTAEDGPE